MEEKKPRESNCLHWIIWVIDSALFSLMEVYFDIGYFSPEITVGTFFLGFGIVNANSVVF